MLLLLALLMAGRLVLAALVPLTPDEAYYTLWSRDLAFGYFDHPPMIASFIRAGTAILGETPLGVRLVCVLAVIPMTWLTWRAAEALLADREGGALAALLLNLTLLGYFGMAVATPDAPLALFAAAMLYFTARLLKEDWLHLWLGLGIATGLAGEAKYSALLLAGGITAAILVVPTLRRRLLGPGPWLAAVAAILVFLPNLLWNLDHGFVTFAKQGGRVTAEAGLHPGFVLEFLAAQAGLLTPLIAVLALAGLLPFAGRAFRSPEARRLLLAAVAVPLLYFLVHALRDRVQGNWPGFLYPALAIAAAAGCLTARSSGRRWFAALGAAAAPLAAAIIGLGTLHVVLTPFPALAHLDPVLRQTRGWGELASDVDRMRRAAGADHVLTFGYQLNAELALALRDVPVAQIDDRERYRGLSTPDPRSLAGPALVVSEADVRVALAAGFRSVEPLRSIDRHYRGGLLERLNVYRVADPVQPTAAGGAAAGRLAGAPAT